MRLREPGWDDRYVEDKYRVFYGPGGEHGVSAFYREVVNPRNPHGVTKELREVEGFTFVLRPDVDSAALPALAAYAAAVAESKPQLAEDLWEMVAHFMYDLVDEDDE